MQCGLLGEKRSHYTRELKCDTSRNAGQGRAPEIRLLIRAGGIAGKRPGDDDLPDLARPVLPCLAERAGLNSDTMGNRVA